jgi:hypothetical protein
MAFLRMFAPQSITPICAPRAFFGRAACPRRAATGAATGLSLLQQTGNDMRASNLRRTLYDQT